LERPSNRKTLGYTIKLENVRITLRYTQKIIKEDLQLVKNCDKPFNPDLEVLETLGNQVNTLGWITWSDPATEKH
jgi:hypothetical protein